MRLLTGGMVFCLISLFSGMQALGEERSSLPQLLETMGIKGGLVICIGQASIEEITAAAGRGPYVIQVLESDPARAKRARSALRERGVYGCVSVRHWDGKQLPYVDNLVNVLVVSGVGCPVSGKEIERALAPGGVAFLSSPSLKLETQNVRPQSLPELKGWLALSKPVPAEIDDWSHYLHGPGNNAIASDTVVGPPRHIQWRSKPLWGRDHHKEKGGSPTVRIVLSAGGRLFILSDQTETSNMNVDSVWTLTARDAFSGVLLWTTHTQMEGYTKALPDIWRRLVVDDKRVYTAFGSENTLIALDAATGKQVCTYKGTAGMDELVKAGTTLYVLLQDDTLLAVQAEDGKEIWRWKPQGSEKVAPLTLAVSGGNVFLKTGRTLSCLSAENGKTLYRTDLPGATETEDSPLEGNVNYPGKLVVADGVVLCSYGAKDPVKYKSWAGSGYLGRGVGAHRLVREYGGKIGAFSANDGKILWETDYYPDLQDGPGEIYIRDGLVWLGPLFDKPRDLRTGEIKMERPIVDQLWTEGHHYRCYMGKATSNYFITAKRGVEMINVDGENHYRNNWVRGTCQVGITPCNGLLYAPPHSCGCYMEAKLFGFWALAGTREESVGRKQEPARDRLEKGPAYSGAGGQELRINGWWTYRGGCARGGSTEEKIGSDLEQVWKTELGGRLTAATVADRRVFVAQVDAHTLYALDSSTGKKQWSFTAGGRIDSPPTIVGGLVLFGCRDGYVYCLTAGDGTLVWRYLVAPARQQAVAFDQVESVWPVHGSILYQDGTVYAAAGRSSYLDGGIRIVGLAPVSGELRCEKLVRSEHAGAMPPTEDAKKRDRRNSQNWSDYKTDLAPDKSDSFSMGGATADVLVGAHDSVYMRHKRFNGKLEEMAKSLPHLFSTSELLDGWEHNRMYWILGTGDFSNVPVAYPWIIMRSLKAPVGMMMAFDDRTAWTANRYKTSYRVSALQRSGKMDEADSLPDFNKDKPKAYKKLWTQGLGLRPRSVIQADELLILGGVPKGLEGNPYAAGGAEGRLQILSCTDGKTIREMKIASPPVWDGMAAASGSLFIPCVDGSVISLGPTEK